MKVKDLIAELLKRNTLDDEVIVVYWDKAYFIDDAGLAKEEVERVWDKFIPDADETLMGDIEFTQTGHDLVADLESLIQDKELDE
jgi:hypothetical protein